MMLIDASWPSNRLVAVTRRILFLARKAPPLLSLPPLDESVEGLVEAEAVEVTGRFVKEWDRPSL